MRLTLRDLIATALLLAIGIPYVGYLVAGEMPLVEDARGMSAVGLLLGAVMFFGFTVRGLGLGPTLLVTTFVSALAGHDTRVVRALLIAAGLTALCLVVFVALLQLRLPILGDWLGG